MVRSRQASREDAYLPGVPDLLGQELRQVGSVLLVTFVSDEIELVGAIGVEGHDVDVRLDGLFDQLDVGSRVEARHGEPVRMPADMVSMRLLWSATSAWGGESQMTSTSTPCDLSSSTALVAPAATTSYQRCTTFGMKTMLS